MTYLKETLREMAGAVLQGACWAAGACVVLWIVGVI